MAKHKHPQATTARCDKALRLIASQFARLTERAQKRRGFLTVVTAMVLVGMAMSGRSVADSPPPPDALGTFLGRTVACSCVSGEQSTVLAMYRDFMEGAYGETYADQASGHMRLALREAYDNQLQLCRYTCGRDLIADLQELIDRRTPYAEIYAESAEEWEPTHTSGYYDLEDASKKSDISFCRSQPSRPECRDF